MERVGIETLLYKKRTDKQNENRECIEMSEFQNKEWLFKFVKTMDRNPKKIEEYITVVTVK